MQNADAQRSFTPPSTESNPTKPQVEVTPRSRRSTGHGDQTTLRNEIAQRMNSEMLTCDLNTFCNHYLPFSPTETEIEGAVEHLARNGILSESSVDGKHTWTDFDEKPSDMSLREDAIFAHIESITQALSGYGIEGRHSNFAYRGCPNTFMKSEIDGGNFKVDGRFERAETISSEVLTDRSAVIAEYKKYGVDDVRNRKQLLSAANHIMNDDPRRSAIYGITIVDDKMSLWYFSRSHSVKSDEFSFMKDYRYMVLSLLAFIFATDEEIGYEPKALRLMYQNKWCYIYDVNGRFFRTEENIFSYRSLSITGRNTRVWKVVEVKNLRDLKGISGPFALKDVWLERGAKTEQEIQKEIFNDIEIKSQQGAILDDPRFSELIPELKEEIENCLKGETYKHHFMNIECSELGATSRERPPQAKPVTGLFEENVELVLGDPLRMYKPKQHYLIVYSEVAAALDEADNLITAFQAMKEVFAALLLLYLAGWIHRDVSTGNILFSKRNGILHAQLSDLEYSKRYGDMGGSTDPKTGTPYFMALEMSSGDSFYTLDLGPREQLGRTAVQKMLVEDEEEEEDEEESKGDEQVVRVFHNYQHDLESLWWMALWFLLCRVEHAESNHFGSLIFTDDIRPTDTRIDMFKQPAKLRKINIHPDLKSLLVHFRDVSKIYMGYYVDRGRLQLDKIDVNENFSAPYSIMWLMLVKVVRKLERLDAKGKLPSLRDEHVPKPPSQVSAANTSQKRRSLPSKEDDQKNYSPSSSQKRQRQDGQLQTKKYRTRAQTKLSNPRPQ